MNVYIIDVATGVARVDTSRLALCKEDKATTAVNPRPVWWQISLDTALGKMAASHFHRARPSPAARPSLDASRATLI